ncbi:MAG: response-associated peptidase [Edaphobacter sp.]|nr:response-associated peptidase [Edaphobacter sp.]
MVTIPVRITNAQALRPFDSEKMIAWKVDNAVGNVKNDRPDLIEPASATPESVENQAPSSPGSLFSYSRGPNGFFAAFAPLGGCGDSGRTVYTEVFGNALLI